MSSWTGNFSPTSGNAPARSNQRPPGSGPILAGAVRVWEDEPLSLAEGGRDRGPESVHPGLARSGWLGSGQPVMGKLALPGTGACLWQWQLGGGGGVWQWQFGMGAGAGALGCVPGGVGTTDGGGKRPDRTPVRVGAMPDRIGAMPDRIGETPDRIGETPDGIGIGGTVSVPVGVGVGVGGEVVAQFAAVIVLSSRVTAPVRASARPSMLAPVVTVIDCWARMLPTKVVFVPSVAELPTCQKTLQA